MRIDQIRGAQLYQPFRPFTLHLADGRSFLVDHPEFMLVSRDSRTIVVNDVEGNIEIIGPMLVTSLTVPSGQPESPHE